MEEPDDDVTIAKLHDTVGSVWSWSEGGPVGPGSVRDLGDAQLG